MKIFEQEKTATAGGVTAALSKIPFVRSLASSMRVTGRTITAPLKAIIGAGVEKEKDSFFKQLVSQGGQLIKIGTQVFKVVYAISVAPLEVRRSLIKNWRGWPNMKLRLINIWVLVYQDLEDPNKFSAVYYSPNGTKLVQTTIGAGEAKAMGARIETKPEVEKRGPKEKAEKETERIETAEALGINYNELEIIEEELLDEAFGLPPVAALMARWRYKNQTPTLVRYRLWIVQIYDASRNKTYIRVYDGIVRKGEEAGKPVQEFSYEGKQEILS